VVGYTGKYLKKYLDIQTISVYTGIVYQKTLIIKIFDSQNNFILKEIKIMFEKVKEIIIDQLNVEGVEITAETRFKEDLDADSLDLFEMVMAIEEEYGVEIPSEELTSLLTVGSVVDYLADKGIEA